MADVANNQGMRNEHADRGLLEALKAQFGNEPFTAGEAMERLRLEDLPYIVRLTLRRSGSSSSAAQSLGWRLRGHAGVEAVDAPGTRRVRLWRVKP